MARCDHEWFPARAGCDGFRTAHPHVTDDATSLELAAERRAREDSDAAARVLRALEEVTQAALAPHSLDELLGTVVVRCIAALDVERAAIVLRPRGDHGGRVAWTSADHRVRVDSVDARTAQSDPILRSFDERAIPRAVAAGTGRTVAWRGETDWHGACAPLHTGDDETLGLVEVSRPGEPFTRDEIGLLQLLADRVAVAVDRARAWENERIARAEAERARRQAACLFAITSGTSDLLAPDTIQSSVFDELARYLDARSGIAFAIDPLQPVLRAIGHHGVEADDNLELATVPLTGRGILVDAARMSGIITIDATSLVEDDALADRPWTHAGTIVSLPIVRGTRVCGVFAFVLDRGRILDGSDHDLLIAAAQQAGTAIERALLATERRRMYEAERIERAAAEHRAQAARILDDIGEGVLLVDDAGVLRSCNPMAAAILQLDAERALGTHLVDQCAGWAQVVERVPAREPRRGQSAAAPRTTVEVELSERTAWLSISAVRSRDGVVYAVRDLTDERALDLVRRDLVATVSHELRTPIASVYGAAVTLGREDIELGDDVRHELTRTIERESERLSKIVDDLMVVQKLESRRLTLVPSSTDIVQLVSDAATAFRVRAIAHGRDLDVEIDAELISATATVVVDPQRMQQVLGNLLENARSYSPSTTRIEIGCSLSDTGAAQVWVRDDGIGIAPADQERVFDRFYRVDADMRSGVGGMGLGLYLCRELVRQMDGEIWVRSTPGRGSTFTIELPVAEGDT